ncbi:hypothetical protein M405DRAFT_880862 [Rhizopogon salebrosus TDB-379]|nr:hypothetical protein M405DRAFT_880862 [Rhizopogon salebrosus TDB-379]
MFEHSCTLPSCALGFAVLPCLLSDGSCLRNPDDIVTQKQHIPRHAVYLADLECVDAAKNGRVPAYKQRSRTNGSTDEIPVMDIETEEWSIPSKHKDEFDSMKFDFMACPRIVKPGSSIATSGFERRNAREGPLDVIKVAVTNGGDKEDVRAEKRQRSDKKK